MSTELAIIVAVIGGLATVFGVILSYVTVSSNRKNGTKEDGEWRGALMSDVKYIKKDVQDIKVSQQSARADSLKENGELRKEMKGEISELKREVVSNKESADKSIQRIHTRLDKLEVMVNNDGNS